MTIGNRHDREDVDGSTNCQRGRYMCPYNQGIPTSRCPTRASQLRHAPRSRVKTLPSGRPRFYLIHIFRPNMKPTGWSPKLTSYDNHQVKQYLWVNAAYRWQLTEKHTTKHCTMLLHCICALDDVTYNYLYRSSLVRYR